MTRFSRVRARRILDELGVDHDTALERTSSVTNEVWMTPELVVRVNPTPSPRLRREAHLAQVLPPAIGYPPIVRYGDEAGIDWLILERVPGGPLSRWWPTMSVASRREAARQLAARLELIHATTCPPLEPLRDTPQLLDHAPTGAEAVGRLLAAIEQAAGLERVDRSVMGDVAELVRGTAHVLDPFDAPTLVHGDLTFENVLWDGERITALLDFEWARAGPPDLDLDVLLRFVAFPFLHVAADYEEITLAADYAPLPWWLAEDYHALFEAPAQFERVRLYSISWDIRELLAYPPRQPPGQLHPCHPYHRLVKLLNGDSYLDRMNGAAQPEL